MNAVLRTGLKAASEMDLCTRDGYPLVSCCCNAADVGCETLLPVHEYSGWDHGHCVLAGVLGDQVAISKDKSKVTVTTETAFLEEVSDPWHGCANT